MTWLWIPAGYLAGSAVTTLLWVVFGRHGAWGTPDDHEIGTQQWPDFDSEGEPLPPSWVNKTRRRGENKGRAVTFYAYDNPAWRTHFEDPT